MNVVGHIKVNMAPVRSVMEGLGITAKEIGRAHV